MGETNDDRTIRDRIAGWPLASLLLTLTAAGLLAPPPPAAATPATAAPTVAANATATAATATGAANATATGAAGATVIATRAATAPATAAAPPASEQALAAGVAAEVERLQRYADAKPPTDPDWKSARPAAANALAKVREALGAGQVYQALERLDGARGALRTLDLAKAAAALAGNRGLPGFDAAWDKARVDLDAADRAARARTWEGAPAALRALAETAQAKSLTMLAASRAYARVTSPGESYYYLGQAGAAAEFAAFCYSLRRPPAAAPRAAKASTAGVAPSPLALRSLAPELHRLQQAADDAFRPPRAQQLGGPFIGVSSTLKLAADLDAAASYAGSFYQYLDAKQQLALLAPPPPTAAARAALPRQIAALRARLAASRQDASLGELFLERAAALIPTGPPAAANPAAWAPPIAIVEQVLPAYFKAAAGRAGPGAASAAPAAVTVTLIRWPYT